jgi:predicted protein tyrosine phosphatase
MALKANCSIEIAPVKAFLYDLPSMNQDGLAAIIVSSYEVDAQRLQMLQHSLLLYFDDVNYPIKGAFTEADGEKIRAFVEGLGNTRTLYVCCDRGESRSAAMAAAISRFIGQNEWAIWDDPRYHPNPLVYRLTCRALGLRAGKWAISRRLRRSRQALTKAINRARSKR